MLQLFYTDVDVGRNKTVNELFRVRTFNKRITPIRLYQRRIQVKENPSHRFGDYIDTIWDGVNLAEDDNQEKNGFGFGDIYYHSDHIDNEKGGYYRTVQMYPEIDFNQI